MTKNPTWNDIPFNPYDDPQSKADQFDRQYEENKQAGDAKEQAGGPRPEPGMK